MMGAWNWLVFLGPTYSFAQVDALLGLRSTARRWIDGYVRAGKTHPPVVRDQATGVELATWGEFVELLAKSCP